MRDPVVITKLPYINVLHKSVIALIDFTHQALSAKLEAIRVARVAYAVYVSGCSVRSPLLGRDVAAYLVSTQKLDGGWSDVEETLWCLGYLAALGEKYDREIDNGRKWLISEQLPCKAFGKNERDRPRIPITALASVLFPVTVDHSGLEWLANQWEADLISSAQLTYKGAFLLLSQAHDRAPEVPNLVEKTIAYLCDEQEQDGGFGPWKGHPIGSDSWTTGVVLWGLSSFTEQLPPGVLQQAVNWLASNQLPNGLWPYHYLDDGTSMALIGLSSVLSNLSEHR